jgi:hypothetical protein
MSARSGRAFLFMLTTFVLSAAATELHPYNRASRRTPLRSSLAEARVSQRAHLHPTADLSFFANVHPASSPRTAGGQPFPARTLVAARGQALAASYALCAALAKIHT